MFGYAYGKTFLLTAFAAITFIEKYRILQYKNIVNQDDYYWQEYFDAVPIPFKAESNEMNLDIQEV